MNNSFSFIKNMGKGLGVLVLYFLLTISVALVLSNIGISYDKSLMAKYIDILINIGVFFLLFRKVLIRDFKKFKENYKKYIHMGIKYWFMGFIIMMISNLIINYIIFDNGMAGNEAGNRELINKFPIYSSISILLIAPFIEELVFRASFRNAFKKIIPYCIFSGLLFGGLHIILSMNSIKDLFYLIPYGSLGFTFAYAYFKSDTIYTSMFMHMIHNGLTLIVIFLSK